MTKPALGPGIKAATDKLPRRVQDGRIVVSVPIRPSKSKFVVPARSRTSTLREV
jgi:hypothetical protein